MERGNIITADGWTLHHTIGRLVVRPVTVGEPVELPGGRGTVRVISGRAPARVRDTGGVRVTDSATAAGLETRPGALGMVWRHDGGGYAESGGADPWEFIGGPWAATPESGR